MRRFGPWGLLLTLALPGLAPAQAKLAWKWEEGKKFYVRTVTAVEQTFVVEDPRAQGKDDKRVPANDREIRSKFEHIALLSYEIGKKNADGSFPVVQKIESLTIKVEPEKKDTTLGPARPGGDAARLTLHVTPRGEVVKVEGFEDLLKRLAGNDSDARKVLREALSEEVLKAWAGQAFGFLPPREEVKTGATWPRKVTLSLGALGRLQAEHTYTFEGKGSDKDKGLDRISWTTRVLGFEPSKASGLAFQVTEGKFDTAEGKGTLYFDAEAGRPVRASSSIRLAGRLTVKTVSATYHIRLTEQKQTTETTVMDRRPPN